MTLDVKYVYAPKPFEAGDKTGTTYWPKGFKWLGKFGHNRGVLYGTIGLTLLAVVPYALFTRTRTLPETMTKEHAAEINRLAKEGWPRTAEGLEPVKLNPIIQYRGGEPY